MKMTKANEQEIERQLKVFAEVELARAYHDFLQHDAACPPLSLVPAAAIDGWPPSARDHVSEGCLRCRKRVALQWNVVSPPLRSIVRHLVDNTLPDEQQILGCVQDAGQASRILKTINFLEPLLDRARKAARFVASSHPALTLAAGAVFAPAGDEKSELADIHYIHAGLRWTAPIEAGKQYVYVEAANPVSVSILVGSSPDAQTHAEPEFERVELLPLTLRGTQFTWRASSSLGDVAELTRIYGKDYEVIVVVTSDDK
jgi:hypothetical protein